MESVRGEQLSLIVGPWDSCLEALKEDVKALGGSTKVGAWFIPEKDQVAQRNYVNDRLNAERRERFSDDQVELIMRRAVEKRGYSAAHWYLCDSIGVERPKAIAIEDQRDRAMRQFVEAAASMERMIAELRRLNINIPVRAVS